MGRRRRSRRPRRPRSVGPRDRAEPSSSSWRSMSSMPTRCPSSARRDQGHESSEGQAATKRRIAAVPLRRRTGSRGAHRASRRARSGPRRTTVPGRLQKASTRRARTRSRRRIGSSPRSSVWSPLPGPGSTWASFASRAARRVRVWAVEGDLDVEAVVSNEFELEWPPHSGETRSFPEIDRAAWMPAATARRKLVKGSGRLRRPARHPAAGVIGETRCLRRTSRRPARAGLGAAATRSPSAKPAAGHRRARAPARARRRSG